MLYKFILSIKCSFIMVALLTVISWNVRLSEVRPLKTVRCATSSQIWRVALMEVPLPFSGDFLYALLRRFLTNHPNLHFPQKCTRVYRPFWSFCLLWFFFVAKTSTTRFFPKCWKVKYLRHLWINHHNFLRDIPLVLQVLLERNSNPTLRRTSRTTFRCSSTRKFEIEF